MNNPASAPPQTQDPGVPPSWAETTGVPVMVTAVRGARFDGRALIVYYHALPLRLYQPDDPLEMVRCATATAAVEVGDQPVTVDVTFRIQGHVTKDADARVALLGDFAGKLHALEFGYGTAVHEPLEVEVTARQELHRGQHLAVTLVLTAERKHRDAAARLWLDGFDATMAVAGP